MSTAATSLLKVRELTVEYQSSDGRVPVTAVDRLSLDIHPGEVLGVLGESGCGKSTLALTLLGLLSPGGRVTGGSILFRGQELLGLDESALRRIRGAEISLIFQEPALALHPTRRVGAQIVEVIRAHTRGRKRQFREAAEELLLEVGFRPEEAVFHAYPHQLSGGQRQRIVIAQALACRPDLVIADEPTASLDSTTEGQVLDLLGRLRRRFDVAVLYISHNPLLLQEIADRVMVMYAGRPVETASRAAVLEDPLHPYTAALLACLPPAERPPDGPHDLPSLPGRAPVTENLSPGCRFAPRCDWRMERCAAQDPVAEEPQIGRRVYCFKYSPEQDGS